MRETLLNCAPQCTNYTTIGPIARFPVRTVQWVSCTNVLFWIRTDTRHSVMHDLSEETWWVGVIVLSASDLHGWVFLSLLTGCVCLLLCVKGVSILVLGGRSHFEQFAKRNDWLCFFPACSLWVISHSARAVSLLCFSVQ